MGLERSDIKNIYTLWGLIKNIYTDPEYIYFMANIYTSWVGNVFLGLKTIPPTCYILFKKRVENTSF